MAKTPIDNLDTQIKKILETFGDDVKENLGEITKVVGRKAAQAVKANSPVGATGRYAAGWTSQFEQTRLGAKATIYNKTMPGLAHLLENGHALVGGGRVAGVSHIKPVEEETVREYEEKIINEIAGH